MSSLHEDTCMCMHAQATRDRVRGKHRTAYREGTNVILLDAGIAKAFPDSASVNRALRLLLDLARHEVATKRSA